MEENPNSGSAEDANKSQTDLGSQNWGLDGSAASESQEIAAGGPLPFPEAEQTSTDSSVALATTTWPAVGEQEDSASWTAPIDENQTTFPEAYLDSSHIEDSGTDLVETNQPLVNETLAESPAMGTDSFLDGAPFSAESTEGEKQETEEPLWASVEPYEKVETRAVNLKELDHTEEFEERDCDNKVNSDVEQPEALAKAGHETMNSTEVEMIRDSEYNNRQPETTVGSYLQECGLEFNGVSMTQETGETDTEDILNTGLGYEVDDCTAVEYSGFEPKNSLGSWNQDYRKECVDNLPFAGNTTIECTQEREMTDVTGLADLDVRGKSTAEVGRPVCGDELHGAEEPAKETEDHSHSITQNDNIAGECDAAFIPFEKDMVLQPGSANTNLSNTGLGNEEDKFVEREAFCVAEELGSDVSVPEALEMDPWQANWDPTVNTDSWGFSSQTNGYDNWPFPQKQDSIDGNMESPWPGFNDKWSVEDLGGLDNCWGSMGVTPSNQNQEASLKQGSAGEQANVSSCGPSKEIGRPLALFQMGNSRNASTESSSSPKENETNSSDLSEDEIANRRYGLLYQEIEADKEEVPTPVCSIV
ncbi:uncharacterized protein LOC128330138 [Hemicordylus capensis]|uniref:uncharacterized protein LOC128330138 n=1 Tax=Hemicordylus capensis TaxID=884348 RepID=UPI0023037132|nr:uncharacterized protein LOC128330138 [Hemicordylus capensis]